MEAACRFLNCREGSVPFNYLGLPVGANPKRQQLGSLCWKNCELGLILGGASMRVLEEESPFLIPC